MSSRPSRRSRSAPAPVKRARVLSAVLQRLPSFGQRPVALRVTADAERTLRFGHPWLFDKVIRKQSHEGQVGDLAVIYDKRERFLALGLYDPTSPIRVRILQRLKPAPIDATWFKQRLAAAVSIREPLAKLHDVTTGYRLVNGENDGLPGLILDRYADTLVLKLYTSAWVPHLRAVLDAVLATVPASRIILRLSRALALRPKALHGLSDGAALLGEAPQGAIVFQENGLKFESDPVRGHKTGFFLDQRDNRLTMANFSRRRTALDVFAYTGGFSVYAARGGAESVTSVDTSRPALEAARRNFALNRDLPSVAKARHETIYGDAFVVMEQLARVRRQFGVVIVDPPSFAKSMAEVTAALEAYASLTRLALAVLEPGGTLMIASCSSHVQEEQFYKTVHQAARQAGSPLKELSRTAHPLDHPISFREGAYLKALLARRYGEGKGEY